MSVCHWCLLGCAWPLLSGLYHPDRGDAVNDLERQGGTDDVPRSAAGRACRASRVGASERRRGSRPVAKRRHQQRATGAG